MTGELQYLSCSFLTTMSLYLAYMPFIKNGGLFIRTNPSFSLRDPVALQVNFFNESETYSINGTVVWITPKGAQGAKPAGIGLQFEKLSGRVLCDKIEGYLLGLLESGQATDTI